jgi:hypothetical protein
MRIAGVVMTLVMVASFCRSGIAGSVIEEKYRRGVEFAVIFAITPDAEGNLVTCQFEKLEPEKARHADFRPSDSFLRKACDEFSKRKWKAIHGLHDIRPVRDFCFWSRVAPDEPACPEYPD